MLRQVLKKNAQVRMGTFVASQDKVASMGDLKLGDLVFYEEKSDVPQVRGYVHHVAVYTGVGALGQGTGHRVAHEVNGNTKVGAHETAVRAAKEGDRLLVYHCENEELRTRAAWWASKWCAINVSFSEARLHQGQKHEKESLELHRQAWESSGLFRAIRYAARRDGSVHYESDDIRPTKGMFCSQFAIVCYHVAGLEAYVKAAQAQTHVSDKAMMSSDWKPFLEKVPKSCQGVIEKYKRFANTSESHDAASSSSNGTGVSRRPGIEFWDFEKFDLAMFPWTKVLTEGMLLDSKIVMPSVLLKSLQADKAMWSEVGYLNLEGI